MKNQAALEAALKEAQQDVWEARAELGGWDAEHALERLAGGAMQVDASIESVVDAWRSIHDVDAASWETPRPAAVEAMLALVNVNWSRF